MEIVVGIAIVCWLACGVISWKMHINNTGGQWGPYDALMIGPSMIVGPVGLWIVATRDNG